MPPVQAWTGDQTCNLFSCWMQLHSTDPHQLGWSLMDFLTQRKAFSFPIWRKWAKSCYGQHHVPPYFHVQILHPTPRHWPVSGRVADRPRDLQFQALSSSERRAEWWFKRHCYLHYLIRSYDYALSQTTLSPLSILGNLCDISTCILKVVELESKAVFWPLIYCLCHSNGSVLVLEQ